MSPAFDYMIFEKFSQIVFLGFIIESKSEVLRIYFADVQVRDIPHHANGEREIKFQRVCFRGLARRWFEFVQPVAPAGSVIVVRGRVLFGRPEAIMRSLLAPEGLAPFL